MKMLSAQRPRKKPLILTERDEKILRAVYTYRYVTPLDMAWLLFKPTSQTHVGEIMASLAGREDLKTHSYLCRFGLPSVGNPRRVYTLGAKGRSFLAERGLPMNWSFRPYKLKHFSNSHVAHQLLVTRCAIAAEVWARSQTAFRLVRVRLGHEFGRMKVIPDCWLLFERAANGNKLPIFLEADRGMEFQKRFKEHVRQRIVFLESGDYEKLFGTRSVTVCYATAPKANASRLKAMIVWTRELLEEAGYTSWASIFRFAAVDFDSLYDLALFDKPVWYRADSSEPMTLLRP